MVDTFPGRRVTAADIAREVGVSRATVGFVLNATVGQTISPATRDRVLETARRLGYRPHLAAQALASGRNHIVLLVLPDWPMDYSMSRHIEEASLVLDKAGYSLVTTTPHPGGKARPLWETLQPDVVVGFLPFTPEEVRQIRASGVAVVTSGSAPAEASPEGATFAQGPRLQVNHLVDRGHKRLAFAADSDPRLRELVAARRDLTVSSALAAGLQAPEVADISEGTVMDTVADWSEGGVTAVVAYNDEIAAQVAGAALRLGLKIPEDLAVIGHDDSPISRLFVPALSTIRLDDTGLGQYFADVALSAAARAAAPPAPTEPLAILVVRETT
jgi:DNA-binding LacI/PurR family transcriptional regulator